MTLYTLLLLGCLRRELTACWEAGQGADHPQPPTSPSFLLGLLREVLSVDQGDAPRRGKISG